MSAAPTWSHPDILPIRLVLRTTSYRHYSLVRHSRVGQNGFHHSIFRDVWRLKSRWWPSRLVEGVLHRFANVIEVLCTRQHHLNVFCRRSIVRSSCRLLTFINMITNNLTFTSLNTEVASTHPPLPFSPPPSTATATSTIACLSSSKGSSMRWHRRHPCCASRQSLFSPQDSGPRISQPPLAGSYIASAKKAQG